MSDPRQRPVRKLIAIVNVVAWAGFWAFGYLALTAEGTEPRQVVIAAVLAFLGFVTGLFAWLRLSRGPR